MTITKRQWKMSYLSSVIVNFVCVTKFCFDPPFFNFLASHVAQKRTSSFPAHPFFRLSLNQSWSLNCHHQLSSSINGTWELNIKQNSRPKLVSQLSHNSHPRWPDMRVEQNSQPKRVPQLSSNSHPRWPRMRVGNHSLTPTPASLHVSHMVWCEGTNPWQTTPSPQPPASLHVSHMVWSEWSNLWQTTPSPKPQRHYTYPTWCGVNGLTCGKPLPHPNPSVITRIPHGVEWMV